MKLKSKTSRRLMILAACGLAGAGTVGGLFLFRTMRKEQTAIAAREEGLQLVNDAKYMPALGKLAGFLETPKGANDREAMLAYAKARENVEEPDGRHVAEAISVYQKAWALDRSDRKTGLHLLDLCNTAGYFPEAREIAEQLRPADVQQVGDEYFEVLRQEVNARIGANPTDPLVEQILQRMMELRPADFPTQVVYIEHLRERGRGSDARRFAESLAKTDSPDRAAQVRLLAALSQRDMPGSNAAEEMFAALCDLVGLDPMSAGPKREVKLTALETLRSAAIFDSLGAFQHTLAVLREGVRQTSDPVVLRVLARRSWMSGRPGDTLTYIPEVTLTQGGTPSEVLVYRGLALVDLDRKGEVKPIIDALAQREGDFRAKAWGPVLTMLSASKETTPQDAITVLDEALKVAKGDPVLLTMMGENKQRLGRFGEAQEAWQQASASGLSTGWTRPWLNQSNMAIALNNPTSAIEAAQAAVRIAPRSMATYTAFFRSQVALLESGFESPEAARDLLSTADRIDAELALSTEKVDIKTFRELVLPGRVLLTSIVKGNDEARKLYISMREGLGGLSNDTTAQIFQTSFRRGLGLESDVLSAWEASEGLTPRVGLAKAFVMRAKGDDAGARAMLKAKADAPPASPDKQLDALAWKQSWAQYLSAANDPGTKDAWVASADFAPANLDAQLAALNAPSVGSDLALVTRLIERAAQLANFKVEDMPPQLRVVRARALLSEPVTADNRRLATEELRRVLTRRSDFIEAQQLLVRALMLDIPAAGIRPQRTEAIAAINTLLPNVPDKERWTLEQAKLYKAEGDLRNASAMFERIAGSETAPLAMRLMAVDEMLGIREFDAAARTLESIRPKVTGAGAAMVGVKLGEVYKALKRDKSARDTFAAVDPSLLETPEFCVALAEGLASYGDTPGADKALARLDALSVPRDQKMIARARFLARMGKSDDAIAMLREATNVAKQSPEAWTGLVALLVELGRMDEARAAVAQAKQALPNDGRVAALDRQFAASTGTGISANMPLEDLAKVLEQNPETKARADGARVLAAAERNGDLTREQGVAALQQRFRDDPALLTLLARTLSNQKPPRLDAAADVVRDAMERHPSSIEAAVFATNLFRQTGNWSEAIRAATAWQQIERSVQADIVVAETRLIMNQPEGVAQMLEPRLASAKEAIDLPTNVAVVTLYGRALIMSNKADQAASEVAPLLPTSGALRSQFWLPAAGQMIAPEAKAREWIDRVKPMINAGSEEEQLALAGAYASAAARFKSTSSQWMDEAVAAVRRVTARADATARAWEAQGAMQQSAGKPEAKASFQKALELDPKSVFAMRGLASLTPDANEAVRLTGRVLELTGPGDQVSSLMHGQALAAVARQATEPTEKTAQFNKAAEALIAGGAGSGANLPAALTLVEALDGAGKIGDAIPVYDALLARSDLPAGARPALQNNLADSIVRAGRTGVDLDRAHALAEQATTAQPNAAFFDTMGMVERARGERALAITAYRKAVTMDASAWGSWVALAELLKTGTPEEQAEAKRIIETLRKAGEAVPSVLRERLVVLGQE